MSRCPIPCSFFNRDNVSEIERIAATTFSTLAANQYDGSCSWQFKTAARYPR